MDQICVIVGRLWRRILLSGAAVMAAFDIGCDAQAIGAQDYNHVCDLFDAGKYSEVVRVSDSLTSAYRPGITAPDSLMIDVMGFKASALYRGDMPDKAVETSRIVLKEIERLCGRFNPWYGGQCISMATYCYASQAYFKECVAWESLGIQIRKSLGENTDFSRLSEMWRTSREIGEPVSPAKVTVDMPLIYDTDCRRSWEKASDVRHYRLCRKEADELLARGDTLSAKARDCFAALAEAAMPLGYYDEALAAAGIEWLSGERLYGPESLPALEGAYRYASVLQKSGKDIFEPKQMCNAIVSILDSLGKSDCELYVNALMLASTGYSHIGVGGNALDNARLAMGAARQAGGEDSRLYDAARFLCGQQEYRFGKRQSAIDLVSESVEWRRRNLPEGHPELVNAVLSYAGFLVREGRMKEALPLYEEFVRMQTDNIRNNFAGMTVDEQRGYWNQYQYYYRNVLPGLFNRMSREAGNKPVEAPLAYNSALIYKGLLLNSERYMAEILTDADSANARRLEEIAELKHRRDVMLALETDRRSESVYGLSKEIYALQQQLLLDKADYTRYVDRLLTDWHQVRQSLRKGEAAVEFVSVDDSEQLYAYVIDGKKTADGRFVVGKIPVESRRRDDLAAVVIAYGAERPVFVHLGDMNDFGYFEMGCQGAEQRMRRLVWDRVFELLPASTTDVYFAPDGRLHQMPVESLAGLDGGIRLHRVTSTAELTRRRNASLRSPSALVYGGLLYAGNGEGAERDFRKGSSAIGYLPGSKREVENIKAILTDNVTIVTGSDGTEAHFRSQSGLPVDIIHLSTHGYFISPDEFVSGDSRRETDDRDLAMLSSGLLFAGASAEAIGLPESGAVNDGVMTAADISAMKLDGTRLVVLSACESGLGRIDGDGVFGLQRGFKKAGAGSLLMSLWRVDDDATAMLMTEFYKGLSAGRTPYDSLESAKRAVRSVAKWQNPRFWASFVLIDAL